jgi:Tfp pilus assembly protein PilF
MKYWIVFFLCSLLTACATGPGLQAPEALLRDDLFAAPAEKPRADTIFAVSPAMKRYLNEDIASHLRAKGRTHGLIDALYTPGQLKLEYDSSLTRTAAEAFDARSGNCLSLVIMTAAFAREMGLPVHFQGVYVDEVWARVGGILFANGHVNLTLGELRSHTRVKPGENVPLTVDFILPELGSTPRSWALSEETIIAMYFNNRAAEAMAEGDLNQAYWFTREAIRQDPKYLAAQNTLGVVYRRHGNLREAEMVLNNVLAREPGNINSLSNLAVVLKDEGRTAEALALNDRIEKMRPFPPFHFFDLGMLAMRERNFAKARDLFAKEVARAAYNDEFHFWLGAAYMGLGEHELARKHIMLAMENSLTRRDHDLYASKLAKIRSEHRS